MKTKYIGHRGARGEKPENTLLGIRYALELGLDGVEIDVHLSKDEELIIIHDETLDRTTNGHGLITKSTIKEIKKLDAGLGEKVPTLSEVIDLMKEFDKELLIEMKVSGIEKKVLNLIKEKKFSDLSIIKSFNHRSILNFKTMAKNIRAQVLIDCLPVNPVSLIKSAKADGLSIKLNFLDEIIIDECHQAGYFVTSWNANTKEDLAKFTFLKTDYLCTDFPILLTP
jgi:glycerophosphoryl diester phosphodiesterase